MPMHSLLLSVALASVGRAADPVVVHLHERAAVGRAVVTVGDVAQLTGGTPEQRDRVARLDLLGLTVRDTAAGVNRRQVEFRLRLAGADASVSGAERVAVTVNRRPVTADEVVAAARAELLKWLPGAAVEPVLPVAVKLPEVPAAEPLTIAARPHADPAGAKRVQMDVTVSAAGEKLLAFPVHLLVNPAAGPAVAAPAAEVAVKPRQRVTLLVRIGELRVTAVGETQQEGRVGQTVRVQNVDSGKVLSGRVTGPAAVEIDLGGTP